MRLKKPHVGASLLTFIALVNMTLIICVALAACAVVKKQDTIISNQHIIISNQCKSLEARGFVCERIP